MTTSLKILALPMFASTLALAACGDPVEENDTVEVPTEEPAEQGPGTVVDVASGNQDFSTLVRAVQAAQLAETLSGEGPFTVFAPTDAAFEKLPAGALEDLLLPENREMLSGLLTYHVVPGRTDAAALTQAITDGGGTAELTTVHGGTLTATLDGESVVLTDAEGNTSTVTATDVEASNGVIHVIDTVVMPASE